MKNKKIIQELDELYEEWNKSPEKTYSIVPQQNHKRNLKVFGVLYILLGVGLIVGLFQGPEMLQRLGNKAPVLKSSSSAYEIVWTITDEITTDPRYTVYCNGTIKAGHDNQVWASGFPIVVDVGGHQPGEYNYTIEATDGVGGYAEDMVILTVTVSVSSTMEIDSPPDIGYDYDDRYGVLKYKLNDTLDLTIPDDTTSHNLNDGIGVPGGVIEFVFKPLENLDAQPVLISTNTNEFKIHTGPGQVLWVSCEQSTVYGQTSFVTGQTYRVRIEFDYIQHKTVWFVDGILDGEVSADPQVEFNTWYAGYAVNYVSVIIYEFWAWQS